MSAPEITTKSSRIVYRNRWMTVREDEIVHASGVPGIYGVVEKADYAIVAAIEGSLIYLVEQYRYPVKGRYWELPQGSWEEREIEPLALAAAELREETGLLAASIQHIGHLFTASGYSTQGYNLYLATQLTQGEAEREPEEAGLIARAFEIEEVLRMVGEGIIKDASTVSALGLLKIKGLI